MGRFFILSISLLLLSSCITIKLKKEEATKSILVTDSNNAIVITKSDTSIYITLAEKNLGTLYAGESIEGSLKFVNKTGSSLSINEIKGSCGCMTISDRFDKIEIDEVKQLRYTIDTSGKSADEYFDIIISTSEGKYIIELSANIK